MFMIKWHELVLTMEKINTTFIFRDRSNGTSTEALLLNNRQPNVINSIIYIIENIIHTYHYFPLILNSYFLIFPPLDEAGCCYHAIFMISNLASAMK